MSYPNLDPLPPGAEAEIYSRILRTVTATPSGCWMSSYTPSNRYAQVKFRGRRVYAHRVAFAVEAGMTLPELGSTGGVVDHVRARGCVGGHCVLPAHLELVTPKENTLRGDGPAALNSRLDVCVRGHLLRGANLDPHRRRKRERGCRVCRLAYPRVYAARRRGVALPMEEATALVLVDHPELTNLALEGAPCA